MAARRQVTHKMQTRSCGESKANKCEVLGRMVSTTKMCRAIARWRLSGPKLPDPIQQVDERELRGEALTTTPARVTSTSPHFAVDAPQLVLPVPQKRLLS